MGSGRREVDQELNPGEEAESGWAARCLRVRELEAGKWWQ